MSKMDKRTTTFALVAGGVGLLAISNKAFEKNLYFTNAPDPQKDLALKLAAAGMLTGIGLALYGTYRVSPALGLGLGAGLAGLYLYNRHQIAQGLPVVSYNPFAAMTKILPGASIVPPAVPAAIPHAANVKTAWGWSQ